MNNIFVIALCVSIIFCFMKFFELRFIIKEKIVLKKLTIDTIIVYFSVLFGFFLFEQFSNNKNKLQQAPVFIDTPNF